MGFVRILVGICWDPCGPKLFPTLSALFICVDSYEDGEHHSFQLFPRSSLAPARRPARSRKKPARTCKNPARIPQGTQDSRKDPQESGKDPARHPGFPQGSRKAPRIPARIPQGAPCSGKDPARHPVHAARRPSSALVSQGFPPLLHQSSGHAKVLTLIAGSPVDLPLD